MPPAPTFNEILERLKQLSFPEKFDTVVAIANGGLLPASLLQEKLGIEMNILRINFRNPDNSPRGNTPILLCKPNFAFEKKRILLADDRIKTGATIAFAKEILAGATSIKTFAINGNADYALFDQNCFPMPWRIF